MTWEARLAMTLSFDFWSFHLITSRLRAGSKNLSILSTLDHLKSSQSFPENRRAMLVRRTCGELQGRPDCFSRAEALHG